MRAHNFGLHGRARPARTALSTAVPGILLIRMRAEVQVLPGPLPALTSRNAGPLVRRTVGEPCAGSRTLTWLPLLVMSISPEPCPARSEPPIADTTRSHMLVRVERLQADVADQGPPPQLAQDDPDATPRLHAGQGRDRARRPGGRPAPDPLEAAGSEGMFVGRLRADLADPHAVLFWSVADSLRTGAARNAIQIAVFLLRGIPGLTRQLMIESIGRPSRPGRSA
jgi:hypothetical protein